MLETKIEALTQAILELTDLISEIERGKSNPNSVVSQVERLKKDESYVITHTPAGSSTAENLEIKRVAPVVVDTSPCEIDPVVAKEIIAAIDKTAMPAPPSFEPVVEAAPVANAAPFTDGKGLIDFVMTIYKELGAEKGAGIQGVLAEMGLNNVNEVRPTEYDTFYQKVMALKG